VGGRRTNAESDSRADSGSRTMDSLLSAAACVRCRSPSSHHQGLDHARMDGRTRRKSHDTPPKTPPSSSSCTARRESSLRPEARVLIGGLAPRHAGAQHRVGSGTRSRQRRSSELYGARRPARTSSTSSRAEAVRVFEQQRLPSGARTGRSTCGSGARLFGRVKKRSPSPCRWPCISRGFGSEIIAADLRRNPQRASAGHMADRARTQAIRSL